MRSVRTGEYCQRQNRWVEKAEEASDFEDVKVAVQWAAEVSLEPAEVVLTSEDPEPELVLPLYPELLLSLHSFPE